MEFPKEIYVTVEDNEYLLANDDLSGLATNGEPVAVYQLLRTGKVEIVTSIVGDDVE